MPKNFERSAGLENLEIWQPASGTQKTIKRRSYLKAERQTQRRTPINPRAIKDMAGHRFAGRKRQRLHCLLGNMVTAVILNSYKGFAFLRCSLAGQLKGNKNHLTKSNNNKN